MFSAGNFFPDGSGSSESITETLYSEIDLHQILVLKAELLLEAIKKDAPSKANLERDLAALIEAITESAKKIHKIRHDLKSRS
jgi:hypothetical protein